MATIAPMPRVRFVDSNGDPLVGGKVYVYYSGTSAPADTYTDYVKSSKNSNPVLLDVRGEAAIFLEAGLNYKFVVKDVNDSLIYTQDGIYGSQRVGVDQNMADQAAISATSAAASAASAASASASASASAVIASGSAGAVISAAEYLTSYMDQVVMNVTFPLDLGLISDPVIYNNFDLGVI